MPGAARTLAPALRGLLAAALAAQALSMSVAPEPFERLELSAADLRLRLCPRPQPARTWCFSTSTTRP